MVKRKREGVGDFRKVVRKARAALRTKRSVGLRKLAARALIAAKRIAGRSKAPRVLPLPKKIGGFLPLIPLFAGLSAVGALAGGAAGVAKAVNDAQMARKKYEEMARHNRTMEAIGLSRGSGLYLKPYRKGVGLYLDGTTKNF